MYPTPPTYYSQPVTYAQPENKVKFAKTKGFFVVAVGIILAILQAIFTIPSGGGIALFTFLGSIFGIIGLIIVLVKNKFIKKVKLGVIIAIVLMIMAVILSMIQFTTISKVQDDMASYNSHYYYQHDKLQGIINGLLLIIVLLAVSTALIAISLTIPPILGKDKSSRLMFIPLILSILAIVLATILTYNALSKITSGTITVSDAILGSQVGGVLNFISLLMVLVLSFIVRVEVEPAIPAIQSPQTPLPPGQYVMYTPFQPAQAQPMQTQYQPAPPQAQQYNAPPPPNICKTCNSQLTFIPQSQAWYCYKCQKYA